MASKVKDTSSDVDTNSIMTPTPKLPGFDELDGQKNNDETDRSYTENAINGTIDALDTSWDEESYGDLPIENDFSNSSVPPLGINIKPLLSVSLASTSKLELSHDTGTSIKPLSFENISKVENSSAPKLSTLTNDSLRLLYR